MEFMRSCLCALLIVALVLPSFLSVSVGAQTGRRLAVIDVDAEFISPEEKTELLRLVKLRMENQRALSLIRDEEINSLTATKNSVRDDVERVKAEHIQRHQELEKALAEAEKYYLASQFEEAIPVLEGALLNLSGAALVMTPELPSAILKLLAACQYFVGKENSSKISMATLLDFNDAESLDPQKFPPPLIDLFNQVKRENRFVWPVVQLSSNVKTVRASLWGKPLEVQSSDGIILSLPQNHPILGSKAIVLEADDHAPIVFIADKAPQELKFVSTLDRRLPTRGLFRPIGSLTPPVELKRLVANVKADVVFLGSAERLQDGSIVLEGQWLEDKTNRTSPVVRAQNRRIADAVEVLMSQLMDYLSPEGIVLGEKSVPYEERPEEVVGKPYYETWWFWTVVGVAAATGLGVGGYFLFKPDDKLKVRIQPAP